MATRRSLLAAGLLAFLAAPAMAQRAAPASDLDGIRLEITGPEETVLRAESMTCRGRGDRRSIDVTDVPPTAFRRDDGSVLMLAGNRQNYYLEGQSLDDVTRTACHSLLPPEPKDDPAAFQDNEWLSALYSFDGKTVYGFVHNEYHGEEHGHSACQVTDRRNRACWYASTTLVKSSDGGHTFHRPPPSEDNVVAALPYRFSTDLKRTGLGAPKIVGAPDGKTFYVLSTFVDRNRGIKGGQCLIKADGLDTAKWRAWDGKGFDLHVGSPYLGQPNGGQHKDCTKVIDENIMSVKYMPSLKAYVALGIRRSSIVYAFSRDLVHWTQPRELTGITSFATWKAGEQPPVWYVSLLDPTSRSRNFDTLEQRPYLYFVRFHVKDGRLVNGRRDLIRRRITVK